jgi:hypothetical protein
LVSARKLATKTTNFSLACQGNKFLACSLRFFGCGAQVRGKFKEFTPILLTSRAYGNKSVLFSTKKCQGFAVTFDLKNGGVRGVTPRVTAQKNMCITLSFDCRFSLKNYQNGF